MKIFLGADHGGFALKEKIKEWLAEWGYDFEDCGAQTLDPEDDYPQFAFAVGEKVVSRQLSAEKNKSFEANFGILACRSAAGVVMAANKVKGVRAFAAFTTESAKHARKHNNANVIALSGDWLKSDEAKAILKVFLETEFSTDERHRRRVGQISEYENR